MKFRAVILLAAAVGAIFLRADDSAPPSLPANVKDMHSAEFSSEEYFDPPFETRLKLRFSGGSVSPLPGGLQSVSRMRIEIFTTNGELRAVAEAPQCEMSLNGEARSAGPLEMRSGDGKFHVAGEGFCWQSSSNTLIISNRVHTVFKTGTNSLFKL